VNISDFSLPPRSPRLRLRPRFFPQRRPCGRHLPARDSARADSSGNERVQVAMNLHNCDNDVRQHCMRAAFYRATEPSDTRIRSCPLAMPARAYNEPIAYFVCSSVYPDESLPSEPKWQILDILSSIPAIWRKEREIRGRFASLCKQNCKSIVCVRLHLLADHWSSDQFSEESAKSR